MSWSDYGFTDVTLLPSTIPSMAIMKACRERARLSTYNWPLYLNDWDVQIMEPIMEPITSSLLGATRYAPSINHLLDWTGHPEEALWNQNTLRQAVFDRYPGNLSYIPPQNDQAEYIRNLYMTYGWHRDAAIQQYIFVNLQKILDTYYTVTMGYGYAQSTSSDAAWDAACANFSFSEVKRFPESSGDSWSFDTRFTNDGDSTVSCIIRQPMKIEPDYDTYPELIGLPGYIYTNAYYYTDDRYYGFDLGNTQGWSKVFSLPYHNTVPIRPIATLPTYEEISQLGTSYGVTFHAWSPFTGIPHSYCGVDCSSIFEFYDNVDEIQTS